jgi:acyl carrier protein
MDKRTFLSNMEEVLEMDAGSLEGSERLDALDRWDSLAVVSFIAMADAKYGVAVPADALRDAKTVDDLMKLVGA